MKRVTEKFLISSCKDRRAKLHPSNCGRRYHALPEPQA